MSTKSSSIVLFAMIALVLSALPATAQGDTTPPQLQSLSVSPNTVDASTSAQSVTVTAVITDDLSGVSYEGDSTPSDVPSFPYLYSPSANQSETANFTLVSGDTYSATFTIPQYAEQGIWRDWSIYLTDEAGNYVRVGTDWMVLHQINAAVGVSTFQASYDRTVSLKLRKTKAYGHIGAPLESACFWFVPVTVQRRTSAGWRKVGSTLSAYNGSYSVRIRKTGKYRATATEFGIGAPTVTTCSKASAVKRI